MINDDIIRMALEAGLERDGDNFFSRNYEEMDVHIDDLKRFAEFVAKARDAEHAEKLKYDIHSCGPTCERYVCVAIRNAVSDEREACAKIFDDRDNGIGFYEPHEPAEMIRARGNK